MRKVCAAEDCNKTFEVTHVRKMFCSPQCRDRVKRRRIMKRRIEQGLCPQCGGEMDYPVSVHRNKVSPTYCSKCQEYYKDRYKAGREEKEGVSF